MKIPFPKANNIKIPSNNRSHAHRPTSRKLQKGLYDRVNLAFEKICEVSFATAMTKVPELEL